MTGPMPPRHAIEVVLRIDANAPADVIRALKVVVEGFLRRGVRPFAYAGTGYSMSCEIAERAITPEQFQAEMDAWFDALDATPGEAP